MLEAKKFEDELSKIIQLHESIRAAEQEAFDRHFGTDQKYKKLLAIGNLEAAKELKPELDRLHDDWREKAQAAEGIESSQDLEQLVASAPDSQLYQLAQKVVNQGNANAEKYREQIVEMLETKIPEAKQAYLKVPEEMSSIFTQWFHDANEVLKIQKFLPKSEQTYGEPNIPAPNASKLTIDMDDIKKVYRRLSTVVNLAK